MPLHSGIHRVNITNCCVQPQYHCLSISKYIQQTYFGGEKPSGTIHTPAHSMFWLGQWCGTSNSAAHSIILAHSMFWLDQSCGTFIIPAKSSFNCVAESTLQHIQQCSTFHHASRVNSVAKSTPQHIQRSSLVNHAAHS